MSVVTCEIKHEIILLFHMWTRHNRTIQVNQHPL